MNENPTTHRDCDGSDEELSDNDNICWIDYDNFDGIAAYDQTRAETVWIEAQNPVEVRR